MAAPDLSAQLGAHDAASDGGNHLGGIVGPQGLVERATARMERVVELRREREQAVRAGREQQQQLAAVRAAQREAWCARRSPHPPSTVQRAPEREEPPPE